MKCPFPIMVNTIFDDNKLSDEVEDWIVSNVKMGFERANWTIWFESEVERLHFKLRWLDN